MRLAGIKKIAVIRVGGIGDWIFSLPAVHALKAAYPDAEIILLAKSWHTELYAGRPGPIDRVVVVPRYPGVGAEMDEPVDAEGMDAFVASMQEEHLDLAIQMHGGGKNSNPFVRRLGARSTLGWKSPDAEPLDIWMPYVYFQSEILRCLELVSYVGAELGHLDPRLSVTPSDLAEAQDACPESDLPLVALNPGATDPRRRWSPAKFASVGDALVREGAQVIVIGAQADKGLARAIIAAMQMPGLDLSGKLTIGGLVGLLSRCRVVVSNDSGPLHLAQAAGAATVGIYWCGNLINADPMTRTRHRPHLSWRLLCTVCGRNTIGDRCEHAVSFVDDVSIEAVLESALDLYSANYEPPDLSGGSS